MGQTKVKGEREYFWVEGEEKGFRDDFKLKGGGIERVLFMGYLIFEYHAYLRERGRNGGKYLSSIQVIVENCSPSISLPHPHSLSLFPSVFFSIILAEKKSIVIFMPVQKDLKWLEIAEKP